MSRYSRPMSQTTPVLNNLGRGTYFETPRPLNLAGSRSPSSYTSAGPSATQFPGSAHTTYVPPENNLRTYTPDDASSGLHTPVKPEAARLYSSSSIPTNNHFSVSAALRREDALSLNGLVERKRARNWRRFFLWAALVAVVVAGIVVGVVVTLIKNRPTSGGAVSIKDQAGSTTPIALSSTSTTATVLSNTNLVYASTSTPTSQTVGPYAYTTNGYPTTSLIDYPISTETLTSIDTTCTESSQAVEPTDVPLPGR